MPTITAEATWILASKLSPLQVRCSEPGADILTIDDKRPIAPVLRLSAAAFCRIARLARMEANRREEISK